MKLNESLQLLDLGGRIGGVLLHRVFRRREREQHDWR